MLLMNLQNTRKEYSENSFCFVVHSSALSENLSATASALYSLVDEREGLLLILDLKFITRLDSRAIRFLVQVKERLHKRRGELKLIDVPPEVLKLMQNLRLDRYFLGNTPYNKVVMGYGNNGSCTKAPNPKDSSKSSFLNLNSSLLD